MIPAERQFILIGGLILQELTLDEMILRSWYFKTGGVVNNFSELDAGDLIQVCEDSCSVIWSRDNFWYKVIDLEPEVFAEFLADLKRNVFIPSGE